MFSSKISGPPKSWILPKLCERGLSTGETCTCDYVTLLQSFYRGRLSIHWYIAQNFSLPFPCPSYLVALFRLPCLADS